jgi:ABC-type branched-subunit amino acid transport system substrate-binding protein
MRTKKLWIKMFVLTVCAFLFAPVLVSPSLAAEKVITIGVFNDLTGPTSTMVAQGYGERDYYRYINQKGGWYGWKFDPIMLDTKESIPEETKAFKRFTSQDNVALIHGWSTGGTKALRPEVNRVGVCFLANSLSQDAIGAKYPYNFIFGPTYEDQVKAAIDLMAEKGGKTLVILRSELEWGVTTYNNIEESGYAKKAGIKLLGGIPIPPNSTDLSTQLLRFRSMNPDFGYIIGVPKDSIPVLKAAAKLGVPGDKLIGINWNTHPAVIATAGAAAEGFIASQTNFAWGADNAVMDEIHEFMKKNEVPEKTEFYSRTWFYARTGAEAIRRVLEKDPEAPNDIVSFRTKIKDELVKLNYNPGHGLPHIDYSDHQGYKTMKFVQVQKGKFVAITGNVSPKY